MPNLLRRALLALPGLAAWPPARAESGHAWRPWPARRAVPPLQLALADGRPWQLAQQRGQVVLLNFWATWCEPCRAELPSLLRLADAQAAAGLHLVGVNHRESAANVTRFLQAQGLALQTLLDPDGAATKAWTPRIFPSTVLVRRNGRPAGVLVGEFDWDGEAARTLLAPLLAER